MSKNYKSLHIQVAEKLIEQLKAGTAPWQKPWTSALPGFRLPFNAATGNRYKGINILNLLLSGHEDPRWLTFKQAEASGYHVKNGARGTMIQFVKTSTQITVRNSQGKVVFDEQGQALKQHQPLPKAIISNAWVFNAEHISGIPSLALTGLPELKWKPFERAEQLIKQSSARILHVPGNRAYYDLGSDSITLPLRAQFDGADKYYATLLHELGHWTGHTDRLDRSLFNLPGSASYAREELRAEIASMLVGDELKIGHDPAQHAAYVDGWISLLENSPFEIHSAAADAEKIFAYLFDLERRRTEEIDDRQVLNLSPQVSRSPSKYLSTGDEISYKGNLYRISGHLKQGRLRIEETFSGNHFTLSPADRLYTSLLSIKLGETHQFQQNLSLKPEPHTSGEKTGPGIKR